MSGPKPIGYVELVRTNADFRRLWAGNVVSLFGGRFSWETRGLLRAET